MINLQRLFAKMIFGWEKYYDPGEVLRSIVDESGNQFSIGEQKDITEFQCNFLARIEEGIQYCLNKS